MNIKPSLDKEKKQMSNPSTLEASQEEPEEKKPQPPPKEESPKTKRVVPEKDYEHG